MASDTGTWEDEDGVKRDYDKVIYLEIPMLEFERLHARIRELEAGQGPIGRTERLFMQDEIVRLRNGWQDAEAQIAVLQANVLDLQGELAAADERIKELDAECERLRDGTIAVSAKHLNELRDVVARLRAENARLRLFR